MIFDRGNFSWLVFDVVQDAPTILGTGPVFICGRASVDTDADLITVTAPSGGREVAQVGGAEMIGLARHLLRQLHRQDAGA